jgi:hypothetical protein
MEHVSVYTYKLKPEVAGFSNIWQHTCCLMGVSVADRMLIGPDDGYQAETGRPVTRHSLPYRSHHLVVLASNQPLCLVLTHAKKR